MKIVDENRKEVPRGTPGEVAAKGPMIMVGYWNKPKETAAVLQAGWYYSGDAAYMDDEGFVFIVDRLKDMIISGGENVLGGSRERHLAAARRRRGGRHRHSRRQVGRDDSRRRRAAPRHEPDRRGVIDHCRQRIADYKCPRSVEFRDTSLPLSGVGKVLKRELREPFWKGYERRIN